MTIDELFLHLQAEGYDLLVLRKATGVSILDVDLDQHDGAFHVCVKERGLIVDTLFETRDEAAACAWYLEQVSLSQMHLATSADEAEARRQQAVLAAAGIPVRRNDIPNFNGPGDARYRLFVAGSDLKRARAALNLA
jgi:hypothetical protein